MQVEQDVSLAGYSIQISPMLRVGMANYIVNTPGNVKMRNVTAEKERSNYRIADNIDFLDGDLKSSIYHPGDGNNQGVIDEINSGQRDEDFTMYQRGKEKLLGGAELLRH